MKWTVNHEYLMKYWMDWLGVKVKYYLICEGYMPVCLYPDNPFSRTCNVRNGVSGGSVHCAYNSSMGMSERSHVETERDSSQEER